MEKGLIGRKLGMTQIFAADGASVPVTVIEAGPCTVIQKKTEEADGYNAIQLGFDRKRQKNVTKPLQVHFAKADRGFFRVLREFKSRAMVELEPVPEEEAIAEKEFGTQLETSGRVDVMADLTAMDAERLHMLISNHARYTNSKRAAEILADWKRYRPLFRKVMPVEYRRALAEMAKEKAATMQAAE